MGLLASPAAAVLLCGVLGAAAPSAMAAQQRPAAALDTCSVLVNAVTDAGASGDGQTDDTDGIQRAITMAHSGGACVYLPAGMYRVTRDLDWTSPASIVGDPGSAAVLYSPDNKALVDTVYQNRWDRAPLIDNVVFDGLRIELTGPYKSGLVVKRSVFVNRIAPGETPTGGGSNEFTTAQVAVKLNALRNPQVSDSVFLSNRPVDGGTPVYTYRTVNATFSGNLIGADLSSLAWLSQWPGSRSWTQPPASRLAQLRGLSGLPSALGHFQRGGAFQLDQGLTVADNIVNRDPRSQAKSDHALYAWGFDHLTAKGNWLRGWPQAASGGLKVRNGTTATIAGNYLDGTAILLYTYSATNVPQLFQDVVVCGNVYDVRHVTPAAGHSGIQYWRNFAGTGVEWSIAVFDNRFVDPAAGQPVRPDISQSAGDPDAFSAYGNAYPDGSPVPVVGMRAAAPTAEQQARCAGAVPPDLRVPDYTG
ncbi:glycosyl hydrolase family 28-related protein [Actinomadura chibensis]|nr:glycosyl hydrolase family 28-related protein [Actinomadura chibensis]